MCSTSPSNAMPKRRKPWSLAEDRRSKRIVSLRKRKYAEADNRVLAVRDEVEHLAIRAKWLTQASSHLMPAFRRLDLINSSRCVWHAFETYKELEGGSFDIRQFVVHMRDPARNYYALRYGSKHGAPKFAEGIDVTDLDTTNLVMVEAIVEGQDYAAVTALIDATMSTFDRLDEPDSRKELATRISEVFQAHACTPEKAADLAIQSRVSQDYLASARALTFDLVDELRLVTSPANRYHPDVGLCRLTIGKARSLLTKNAGAVTSTLDALLRPDRLIGLHSLVPAPRPLYIPRKLELRVANDLAEAHRIIAGERDAIDSLQPRQFEQLMGNIFNKQGYEVELTRQSRDGGIDLVCLKNLHGIPFRMAVQVKHYPSNPVGVEAVRALAGVGNRDYDKMLVATSGRFTKDAIDFADNSTGRRMELANRERVLQWLRELYSDPLDLL